jgi:S-(hydroxymethyl)glutathione dehydrogenase/alcohol dehydrogenase
MKAAILNELNSDLLVQDVELTNLKVGQVLVKVILSGLCGAQLQEIKGWKGNGKFLPHLRGHEGCGLVESVGEGVTTVKKGDKVVMHWRKGTGIESDFPNYILSGRQISSGKVTTLSEFSIVSENRLTKVPDDTPAELCAMLGCSLTTALGVIDNECDLKFGESVSIIGCGGVGLNLIQAAAMKGASFITAIDINKNKEKLCKELGATEFSETIKNKSDIIIDTTGLAPVIASALSYLGENGRMILVGQPPPKTNAEIPDASSLFNGAGHTIKATQGGCSDPYTDIPRYINLYKTGKLNIKSLVTNYFSLADVNSAFNLLKSGDAGRIMIKC